MESKVENNNSSEEIKKRYLKGSLLAYFAVFIGYMAVYLVRRNYHSSYLYLERDYGYSIPQLGDMLAAFAIPYGIGKFVLGIYADQTNAKKLLGYILGISGLANIIMGFYLDKQIVLMSGMALSGFFQSVGGPASYATILKWFSKKSRGKALGIWNTSHNIGGALAPILTVTIAYKFLTNSTDTRAMYYVPGIVAIVIAIFVIFIGKDKPESDGLPPVEEFYNESPVEKEKNDSEDKMTTMEILQKYIFNNKILWVICIANVFLYVVRSGLDTWAPKYFTYLGFTTEQSNNSHIWFEFAAIPGTFVWGYLSDKLKGRRALVCMICLIPIFGLVYLYSNLQGTQNLYLAYTYIGALGFFIFGPQLLIGVAAVECVSKRAVASANGLTGTFGYLFGDLLAKSGLSRVFTHRGWDEAFLVIKIAIICCIVLMFFVMKAENIRIKKEGSLQQ